MTILDLEARQERARNLGQLNGLRMVLVTLQPPGPNPTTADLEVHFYNANQVAAIVADVAVNPAHARQIFPIFGGFRVPAGDSAGQVQVTAVAADPAPEVLRLTVAPIGDYSTYTLGVRFARIDPLFSEIGFRFRPGCFTTDCAPDWCPGLPAGPAPAIDYLARDFDSFRHTLIAAMIERVPGWQPTSEADLDQVLIEVLSAAADELSDFQDRVMNEAYLGSARKRVSLARHSRLMDYHLHQGNQASTTLALEVGAGQNGTVVPGWTAWTGDDPDASDAQTFLVRDPMRVNDLLNRIRLHTWGGAIPALEAGSTSADLRLTAATQADANFMRDLIRNGEIVQLLVQEWRDPQTCRDVGFDPTKRQLLTLIPASAESIHDPDPANPGNVNAGVWVVRVRWREPLARTYCFLATCPAPIGAVDDVSLFHGNLVLAHHGRPRTLRFLPPDRPLAVDQLHYELPPSDACTARDPDCRPTSPLVRRQGVICRLPEDEPLAYRNTPPGGEIPPRTTLTVAGEAGRSALEVILPDGTIDTWDERPNLVHSDDSAEDGDHFVVETDEEGRSLIRFGDGANGRALPPDAEVACRYQIGRGLDGNVGADKIRLLATGFDPLLTGATVWNPLDVTDGRAPEPAAEVIRRVPEAYRARQLRAVTLGDYVRRAEEVAGVARAAARYAWTGSWRTVQIAIDPIGTTTLDDDLRRRVSGSLEAVRLIGEDLEIRPPRFVPLDILVALCIHPDFWPEDVRFELEMEFSDGYTRDGRPGFFHPDRWTFGQELHASEIVGRAQAVPGVDVVLLVRMKRWDAPTPGTDAVVALRANEIVRVQNDPDHLEEGTIVFDIRGGRR